MFKWPPVSLKPYYYYLTIFKLNHCCLSTKFLRDKQLSAANDNNTGAGASAVDNELLSAYKLAHKQIKSYNRQRVRELPSYQEIKEQFPSLQLAPVVVPKQWQYAIVMALEELLPDRRRSADLKAMVEKFKNCFKNRRLPAGEREIQQKGQRLEKMWLKAHVDDREIDLKTMNEEELEYIKSRCEKDVYSRLRTEIYHWKAGDYSADIKCLVYLFARAAPEYAALVKVLMEIKIRQPDFQPKHVLDFGCGVGTALWACEQVWAPPGSIKQYLCVDRSAKMINLAQLLTRGGVMSNEPCHRAIFFQQNLAKMDPAEKRHQIYDLVISAYTLLDLESYEERMRIVSQIWRRTTRYLVLIEVGSQDGYSAIIEARDFILSAGNVVDRKASCAALVQRGVDQPQAVELTRSKRLGPSMRIQRPIVTESGVEESIEEEELILPTLLPKGHVMAPCPSDRMCPMLEKRTPCSFMARYHPMQLESERQDDRCCEERFSYVIMEKGERQEMVDDGRAWSRLLQKENLNQHNIIQCHLCNANGELSKIAVKKSNFGIGAFKFADKAAEGNLVPQWLNELNDEWAKVRKTRNVIYEKIKEEKGKKHKPNEEEHRKQSLDDDFDDDDDDF